ncbi:hypothetical protein PUN4_560051 [Paraburkholderia unamae]|nr:hypothetical protein PUN4_560051 [Paraburkholderia unamae]
MEERNAQILLKLADHQRDTSLLKTQAFSRTRETRHFSNTGKDQKCIEVLHCSLGE